MYISKLEINNFRCCKNVEIEFNEGLNVIIGENNCGKTTIMRALEYIFNRSRVRTPDTNDFNKELVNKALEICEQPPEITIIATLKSSSSDKLEDKAVVASWLTKLETPWEATLTYKFYLPESNNKEYREEIKNIKKSQRNYIQKRWTTFEKYLKKYVSRIYGGNSESKNKVESEYLDKFHCELLDALRDVESKMFTGRNALLKEVLGYFKDSHIEIQNGDELSVEDKKKIVEKEKKDRKKEFDEYADKIVKNISKRVGNNDVLDFAEKTGASIGGIPTLGGNLEENDVLSVLKLMIKNKIGIEVPIINNGMGYNNLIYISLLLSKFKMITSDEYGENAKVFPILLVEEPEAHLHPALQYNFLKFLKDEVSNQKISRQIFITTHSTHITAAVGLDKIICMETDEAGNTTARYPGKVFSDADKEDIKSKKYVERYLDATKSTMLFAKSVLLGEGLAEQILLPVLAEQANRSFDKNHVSMVRVDALTFKHFIKLFGAGIKKENLKYALTKRVACIIDSDPSKIIKKEKSQEKRRAWKKCWPFEINSDTENCEYKFFSGAVQNLLKYTKDCDNVSIFYNSSQKGKTLEYDIALENYDNKDFFNDEIEIINFKELEKSSWEQEEKVKAKKAASYLKYAEDTKGEAAFELAEKVRSKEIDIKLPNHIQKAFIWVCYMDNKELKEDE
ncbi:MAG: AAA family ATPase [Clostridium sp.]|uniref:ATP-dependent nuclease n=1 Tax=Clostridium sp. TaxID=1506 RepID=UPI0039E95527